MNPFGVEALIAAYNEGEEWLEELKSYLFANYQYLRNYFNEHLPDFPVLKLEGTYLVWVDCSVLKKPSEEIVTALLEKKRSGSMKAVCTGKTETILSVSILPVRGNSWLKVWKG